MSQITQPLNVAPDSSLASNPQRRVLRTNDFKVNSTTVTVGNITFKHYGKFSIPRSNGTFNTNCVYLNQSKNLALALDQNGVLQAFNPADIKNGRISNQDTARAYNVYGAKDGRILIRCGGSIEISTGLISIGFSPGCTE
jgi:hypothetical protein